MAFLDHFAMGNMTSRFTSIVEGASTAAPIRSRRNSVDALTEDAATTPTAPTPAVSIQAALCPGSHQGAGSSPSRGLGFAGLLQSLKPKRKDRGSQDSLYPTSFARDEDRDRALSPSASSSSAIGTGGLSVPGPAAISMFSSSSENVKFIPPSPSRSRAGKTNRPTSSTSFTSTTSAIAPPRAPSYATAPSYDVHDAESTPTSLSTSDVLGNGLGMIGLGGGIAGITGTGSFPFSVPIPLTMSAHKDKDHNREREREREIDLTDSPRARAVSIPRVVRTAASESPSPPPTPKAETASSILGLKRSASSKSVKSKSGSASPARVPIILPPSRSTANKPKGLSPPRRAGVSVQARQDSGEARWRGRASPLPPPAGHGPGPDPRVMVWDGVGSVALPPYESRTATEALRVKGKSKERSRSPNAYALLRKDSGDREMEVDTLQPEARKAGRRLSFSKILHPTRALEKNDRSDGRREQHLHMAMSVSGLALSSGYLAPSTGPATSAQLRSSRSPSRDQNRQQESAQDSRRSFASTTSITSRPSSPADSMFTVRTTSTRPTTYVPSVASASVLNLNVFAKGGGEEGRWCGEPDPMSDSDDEDSAQPVERWQPRAQRSSDEDGNVDMDDEQLPTPTGTTHDASASTSSASPSNTPVPSTPSSSAPATPALAPTPSGSTPVSLPRIDEHKPSSLSPRLRDLALPMPALPPIRSLDFPARRHERIGVHNSTGLNLGPGWADPYYAAYSADGFAAAPPSHHPHPHFSGPGLSPTLDMSSTGTPGSTPPLGVGSMVNYAGVPAAGGGGVIVPRGGGYFSDAMTVDVTRRGSFAVNSPTSAGGVQSYPAGSGTSYGGSQSQSYQDSQSQSQSGFPGDMNFSPSQPYGFGNQFAGASNTGASSGAFGHGAPQQQPPAQAHGAPAQAHGSTYNLSINVNVPFSFGQTQAPSQQQQQQHPYHSHQPPPQGQQYYGHSPMQTTPPVTLHGQMHSPTSLTGHGHGHGHSHSHSHSHSQSPTSLHPHSQPMSISVNNLSPPNHAPNHLLHSPMSAVDSPLSASTSYHGPNGFPLADSFVHAPFAFPPHPTHQQPHVHKGSPAGSQSSLTAVSSSSEVGMTFPLVDPRALDLGFGLGLGEFVPAHAQAGQVKREPSEDGPTLPLPPKVRGKKRKTPSAHGDDEEEVFSSSPSPPVEDDDEYDPRSGGAKRASGAGKVRPVAGRKRSVTKSGSGASSSTLGGMFAVMDAGALGVLASSADKPDISAGRVSLAMVTKPIQRPPPPPEADAQPNKKKGLECQYCGKWFERASVLKTHLNCHTGAKPYQCTVEGCDATFGVLSNMYRHVRSHTAPRSASSGKSKKRAKASAVGASTAQHQSHTRLTTSPDADGEGELEF